MVHRAADGRRACSCSSRTRTIMSAALLEPPKYDHASSDAAAYGSVGALIGHDLTHYIDMLGADYDTEHRMRHWWTAEDMQRFQTLAQPLVESVLGVPAAARPRDQRQADADREHRRPRRPRRRVRRLPQDARQPGPRTGLRAGAGPRVLHRLRADSGAQDQRQRAARSRWPPTIHAPEDYRADTVRNLDAWYDAFDVRPGQRLYLAPAARVRVW